MIKISNVNDKSNLFAKAKTIDIPFREVQDCYLPSLDNEKELQRSCSRKFMMPFYVVMQKRKYELYAGSEIDRKMWVAGFEYLIKSSKIVMQIMLENQEEEQKRNQEEAKKIADEHKRQLSIDKR